MRFFSIEATFPLRTPKHGRSCKSCKAPSATEEMIRMNAERDLSRMDETTIAAKFVEAKFGLQAKNQGAASVEISGKNSGRLTSDACSASIFI